MRDWADLNMSSMPEPEQSGDEINRHEAQYDEAYSDGHEKAEKEAAAEIARLRKIIKDVNALSIAQLNTDSIAARDACDALKAEAERE